LHLEFISLFFQQLYLALVCLFQIQFINGTYDLLRGSLPFPEDLLHGGTIEELTRGMLFIGTLLMMVNTGHRAPRHQCLPYYSKNRLCNTSYDDGSQSSLYVAKGIGSGADVWHDRPIK
jgi:hypothetical protein